MTSSPGHNMKDAIQPGMGRNASKLKHCGTVTTIKDDGLFGFIKPHHSLPEGFPNKHVYFNPHGIKFQERDEVEFTLREEDKARPSARMVWLINRVRPLIKHELERCQSLRTLGTIVLLTDGEGWIQVVGNGKEEIQDKGLGKMNFSQSWVACAHMDLLEGDMVEFNASPNKSVKSNKLNAYKIKLVECRERTCAEVNKYLEEITTEISMCGDEGIDLLSSVLSCDAMWMAIGQCRNLSSEVLMKVIDFTELLEKKSLSRKGPFKQSMNALACSGFCDSIKFFVQTYYEQEHDETKGKVQRFLLRILDNVPQKSRMILQVIKLMLPSGQESVDHFIYKALNMVVPECYNDASDLKWSELSLEPVASEILGTQKQWTAQLREVRVKGAYESAEEYVDIYFRLLRANCFSRFQTGIQSYLSNCLDQQDLFIYTGVTLIGYHFLSSGNGIALALQVTPYQHVNNWATCSNLRFGNLLCLSPSGAFTDVIWATVAERDEQVLKKDTTIWVELCDGHNTMETTSCLIHISKSSGRIVMAESLTYYKSYQPILRALQDINLEELSFQEELIHMESPQKVSYAIELDSVSLPSTLDQSQRAAFKQALQQRIAVIQGPPGTGKTFLGIKIIETLLSSTSVQLPILVLTCKNHALDEFLKELVGTVPDGLVRIGGYCEDDEVEVLNLQKLKQSTERSVLNQKLWSESQNEKSQLEKLVMEAIHQLIQSKYFSLNVLLNGLTEEQIESLLLQCKARIPDKSVLMQAREVLPIWHAEKQYLLDKQTPFSERCRKISPVLLKFLDAAYKHWVPAKKDVSKMMQPLPNFEIKQRAQPKRQKSVSTEDTEVDENDTLYVEKERATSCTKSHAYSMDINVMIEMQKNSRLLELAPSAEMLANEIPLIAIHQIEDLSSLTPDEKMVIIQVLLWHNNLEAATKLETVFTQYREACAWYQEVENEHELSILKAKKVVGITITGASIHHSLLKMLQPAIVLVEEAAEVLEPQISAIIGNCALKHLILIGDYKQLRPKVETYTLCQKYHFDISMMERLINNGYPVAMLKLQNRMLPEMADLLLDIYPDLQSNLDRVRKNSPPEFTPSSMFFWSHDDPEDAGQIYCNRKEAERVLKLVLFFLLMGYSPGQITILAAYHAQVHLLSDMLKKTETDHGNIFTRYLLKNVAKIEDDDEEENGKQLNVAIQTIDMYQGDENDIIIVSLVRSNESGQIGFLRLLNRRCVAQSRARCGMYIVGNDRTFLNAKASCWVPLINTLYKRKLIGKQFPIHCPQHKGITEIRATTAEDIPLDQICRVKCYVPMDCGIHLCPKPCRPPHTHRQADCKKIVDFVLPCNHPGQRQCRQQEETIVCQVNCTQMMLCEKHPCPNQCQPMHSHFASLCVELVDFTFDKCQHIAKKMCGQRESDILCCREMTFKFAKCQHDGIRKCTQMEENISCSKSCPRKLTCGHPCEGMCGKICDPLQCKLCEEKREHERKQQQKLKKMQEKKLGKQPKKS